MLPNLIGSLQDGLYLKNFSGGEAWYWKYPSIHLDKNYFIQIMLHIFTVTIFTGFTQYPVQIPSELGGEKKLLVYRAGDDSS